MSEIFDHVVASRYLQPGETTFDDVLHRVANFIGDSDEERAEYYEMMSKGYFLPNSPTLMNAGTDNPMLSACFALPVEDSIEGIFDAVKWAAMVHKQGGGTGFNFHKIRPKGSTVRSTNGVASGVVSFMKVFDAATEAIKQGGKRRGANIGVLPIDHPEIREFITCKQKEGDIKNFNISVMLNDDFMHTSNTGRNAELFNLIAESIWNNGEPGIKFYDAIQKANTTPWLGELIDGNPCSEALLYPFESCNLGSVDVSKFEPEKILDMDRVVRKAVKFLNKVIDKNQYPLPQIDEATKQTRKIGLGVMGLHDLLLKLGIPYDCERAREIATFVMDEINHVASVESEHLAYDYEPYPACTNDAHYRRNAVVTCIAPTGSLSILANCSSGIEPVYSWVYKRKNTVGEEFMYVHPLFAKALKEDLSRVYPDKDDLVYTMVTNHCYTYGTIQNNKFVSPEFKALWKSALDISYKDHILMQSAVQKHVDQAISKTVNMPQNATVDDVKDAILLAWKEGCKGLTIYRTGSREDVVLALKDDEKEMKEEHAVWESASIASMEKRPQFLDGKTYKVRSGCGKLYVTINHCDGKPYEVFVKSAGNGGCDANNNAIGRLISIALRNGVELDAITKQLSRVTCPSAMKNGCDYNGKSCADIIGKILRECDGETPSTSPIVEPNRKVNVKQDRSMICPECKGELTRDSGCVVCNHCGYSRC